VSLRSTERFFRFSDDSLWIGVLPCKLRNLPILNEKTVSRVQELVCDLCGRDWRATRGGPPIACRHPFVGRSPLRDPRFALLIAEDETLEVAIGGRHTP